VASTPQPAAARHARRNPRSPGGEHVVDQNDARSRGVGATDDDAPEVPASLGGAQACCAVVAERAPPGRHPQSALATEGRARSSAWLKPVRKP
jgi:hypothetical protein